jgi:hypothetical protein
LVWFLAESLVEWLDFESAVTKAVSTGDEKVVLTAEGLDGTLDFEQAVLMVA